MAVTTAKPNLQDLPEELVSNISHRLWSDDVHALRLTCKALEGKTLHEWATEYFTEKAFVISTDSLKVLLEIANSPKLRGFLHRIYIMTSYFSDKVAKPCPHGCCCGWQPTTRQGEAWRFFADDQKALRESGQDREMLTEALSKLSSLKDINIVDSTGAVPVNVDIRTLRKVVRLCGRNFQLPGSKQGSAEYFKILSHVWTIVTAALGSSGITTLKSFGTNLGKGSTALCVPLDIRFGDSKLDRLGKALSTIENFHVQLTARSQKASNAHKLNVIKASPHRLQRLANVLPALHTLALDFDGDFTDNVMFGTFMQHLDLSKLSRLHLSSMFTDRKNLAAVFERLESIQELFMNFVNLTKGSWIPLMKQLQKMGGHLDHLHMMYLLEAGKKAYFLAQPDEDEMMDEEDMMFDDLMMNGPGIDEYMDDEDDETDEDMPPLETMDGELVDAAPGAANAASGSIAAPATSTSSAATVDSQTHVPTFPNAAQPSLDQMGLGQFKESSATGPPKSHDVKKPDEEVSEQHASNDHKAPGNEEFPERGYFVCLRGKERIQEQLKMFIQEYNIGETIDPDGGAPPMGGIMGGAMAIPVPTGNAPGQPPNVNNILNGLAGYLGLPPMPGQNGGGVEGGAGGHGGHHVGVGQHGAHHGAANMHLANHAGGQTSGANSAATGNNSQALGGAAAAGSVPPPAMGGMYDEWDTSEESSEFESESESERNV